MPPRSQYSRFYLQSLQLTTQFLQRDHIDRQAEHERQVGNDGVGGGEGEGDAGGCRFGDAGGLVALLLDCLVADAGHGGEFAAVGVVEVEDVAVEGGGGA